MKRTTKSSDLDGLTARLRDETPSKEVESAAGERVWAAITGEVSGSAGEAARPGAPIAGCAGFLALVPAWNAGRLPQARRLLLEDHLRGCVHCRHAVRPEDPARGGLPAGEPAAFRRPWMRWAAAAAVVAVAGLAGAAFVRSLQAPAASARVEQLKGDLFLVSGGQSGPLATARRVASNEGVRTGRDSTALLRLADGSRIEMKERTELAMQPRPDGVSIRLARGSIIVQAAHQPVGRHLFVTTDDCLVSVVGTVFSVSSGTKGSRVSVVEGEVRVAQRGEESVVRPGQQVATSASLAASSVAEDVSWSQDAAHYAEVLRRLSGLREELARTVPPSVTRHSTRLLDLSPPGTVFYAALPNIGETLATGRQFLKSRIEQDDVLRSWWSGIGAGVDDEMDAAFEEIRRFSGALGDEITVTLTLDPAGGVSAPLLLAELRDPAALSDSLSRLSSASHGAPTRLIEGSLPEASGVEAPGELLVWSHDGIVAASPSLELLRRFGEAPVPRARSPFLDRIAVSYEQGAQYLVAADLHAIVQAASENGLRDLADEPARAHREALERTGLLGLDSLVAEARDEDGRRHDRLVVGFNGPRHGIASWLAEPAPMGGLEYVSPDASLVAAFVVKEPAEMLQDVLAIAGAEAAQNPAVRPAVDPALEALGPIASALGGEVVFALDGPLLPIPSWKLVFEAPDAARLQQALEQAAHLAGGEDHGVTLLTDAQPEHTFYTFHRDGAPFDVHAAWDGGYLVVAPTRPLLERTLAQRSAGASLRDAPKFTALLPRDSYSDFSAILYEDLSGAAGALGALTGEGQAPSGPGTQGGLLGALAAFESSRGPTLFCACSESDRIVLSGSSPATVASEVTALLTFGGLAHTHAGAGEAAPPR